MTDDDRWAVHALRTVGPTRYLLVGSYFRPSVHPVYQWLRKFCLLNHHHHHSTIIIIPHKIEKLNVMKLAFSSTSTDIFRYPEISPIVHNMLLVKGIANTVQVVLYRVPSLVICFNKDPPIGRCDRRWNNKAVLHWNCLAIWNFGTQGLFSVGLLSTTNMLGLPFWPSRRV